MRRFAVGSAVALLAAITLLGVVAASSVLVLRVASEEGPNFVVPVPVALAGAGLFFVPRVEASGVARHHSDLEQALHALTHAPDGVYLEVVQGGEWVTVEKRARTLHVFATESLGATVELTLPLASLGALLRAYDVEAGEAPRRRLLPILWRIPRGPLLYLNDGDMEVQVGVWRPW